MRIALVASLFLATYSLTVAADASSQDLQQCDRGVAVMDGAATEAAGAERQATVPPSVAYRLFLRSLVAPPQSDEQRDALHKARRDSIVKGLALSEVEGLKLRAVVNDFGTRIEKLDNRAAEIKDSAWPEPSPAAIEELNALQQQRDELVREVMRTLPRLLSPQAYSRLDRHITNAVVKQIRILPAPATSPARRPQ